MASTNLYLCACLEINSVQLFVIPWTVAPPSSSVHGILQVRRLEWVAISFSRGSSYPGIEPVAPALAGRFFTTREAPIVAE